jgi:hypothetical protein
MQIMGEAARRVASTRISPGNSQRSVNNELSSREPVLGLGPGLCETPRGLIFNNFLQQLRFTIWWRRCND